ncbi:MAG: hypothetical protein GY696_17525, partial [Gammaproteobacteria bacterium]|nr:hypothetical protein [Gammaproteobacteria bacterium]
ASVPSGSQQPTGATGSNQEDLLNTVLLELQKYQSKVLQLEAAQQEISGAKRKRDEGSDAHSEIHTALVPNPPASERVQQMLPSQLAAALASVHQPADVPRVYEQPTPSTSKGEPCKPAYMPPQPWQATGADGFYGSPLGAATGAARRRVSEPVSSTNTVEQGGSNLVQVGAPRVREVHGQVQNVAPPGFCLKTYNGLQQER